MSQEQQILDYLRRGYLLTPLEAFKMFGTLALHSRIAELRLQGHKIVCERTRIKGGKYVGVYVYVGTVP